MNYKKLILNEYRNAQINALNNPFSAKYHIRLFRIAPIYRQSASRQIGSDSNTARNLYDQMRETLDAIA